MSEQLEQDRKEARAFWKQFHAAIFEAGGDVSAIGDMKKHIPDSILDKFTRLNISPVYKASDKMLEYHDKWVVADNKIRQLMSKIDALEERNHWLENKIQRLAHCKAEEVYDGPKLKISMQVDARNAYLRKDDPDYWECITNDMLAKIWKKLVQGPAPAESVTYPANPPTSPGDLPLHGEMYEVKRDAYGKEYAVPEKHPTPTEQHKTLREWLDYAKREYGCFSPSVDYLMDKIDAQGDDEKVYAPDSQMMTLLDYLDTNQG